VDFEEFCSEIIGATRMALTTVRQDMHFNEFLRVLEDGASVFLDHDQFRILGQRLGIREILVSEKLTELMENESLNATSDSQKREVLSGLDFDTVHQMLVDLEEREELHRFRAELDIKVRKGIPEDKFWKYKSELVRMYERFQYYDADRSGRLGYKEVKMLLHSLGLQPYKVKEGLVVDRTLKECDIDKMESLTFYEFLELVAKFRQHQKVSREAKLRREFGKQVKEQGRLNEVELESIHGLLGAVSICGKTTEEREMVTKTVHEVQMACDVVINFTEFEELCQRISERLGYLRVEHQIKIAEQLGIDKSKLVQYQVVFEQLHPKENGAITQDDFGKALYMLLARPPEKKELMQLCATLGIDPNDDLSWSKYLKLLQAVYVGKSGWISKELPFTLRGVSDMKLREILRLFNLGEDYVNQVKSEELPELVGGYLNVKPDANLRVAAESGAGLSQPVSNVGQLVSYATRVAGKGGKPVSSQETEDLS